MPRSNRSWLPDGGFHVTARGVRREPIFLATPDARKLLWRLEDVRFLWDLKAWCLMPNHLHAVAIAEVANLSRAVARITGPYAQWFNKKYGFSGHLFEHRFDAKPIADEAHL